MTTIDELRTGIKSLQRTEHYECQDDQYYSCPASSYYSRDDDEDHECNCGLTENNAKIRELLALVDKLKVVE